ncbi:Hypothetical predicted protein [Mytilus galloprovincialis]|uniref:Uncharacterized protein n=1 Tax=Mytilus galloprovincialis TaxID=29158 RepID=A0A8B6GMS4_MYTGA|nr:Hypothetical predicted protein [Mytilus galloprovincialis]
MAQVLAVPGVVRHGFSYIGQFNHDFGRITGMAATIKGNVLLCDYVKKNLILVDPLGHYLNNLDLDSEPYDVSVTSQNIGFITLPNSRCVLQIDPDRMIVLFKATCNELNTTVFCVSALENTKKNLSETFLGVNNDGCLYAGAVTYDTISSSITDISQTGHNIGLSVVKFHTVNKDSFLYCKGGQNGITYYVQSQPSRRIMNTIYNFSTMDTPTDICTDDYGHIYVSGQGSNNIHRLIWETKKWKEDHSGRGFGYRVKQDYKVLDIPLDTNQGIKEPVSLCFSKDYSKLYIVNEWGKSVLVFDVI